MLSTDRARRRGRPGGFLGLGRLFGRAPAHPHVPVVPAGRRVYAIGDVHGRLDLLDPLLARIAAEVAAAGDGIVTEIVLLGDLIDRGPDSAGVVRRAMAGLGWATLVALKGNHEAAMIAGLDGDRDMLQLWLEQGGDATLASWRVDPDIICNGTLADVVRAAIAAIPPAERAWLADRPLTHRVGSYYFVHAGIRPGVPLDRQAERDALWIRNGFLDSDRDHGVMVVHGHTRTIAVEEPGNRIGIDTGAYATGRLTALGLEGDRRWVLST